MHLEKLTSRLRNTPQASQHVFRAFLNGMNKSLNRSQDLMAVFVKGVGGHRILQPFPQTLDRVELRRVGREIQEMKTWSFFPQKLLHHSSVMNPGIV